MMTTPSTPSISTHTPRTKTILYLHGFASSGASGTVLMLRSVMYPHDVRVEAPDIPTSPSEAMDFIRSTVTRLEPDLIVGTSMGAMYAEQQRGYPRILVNPAWGIAHRLMLSGLGNRKFFNKRADGATAFKVDRRMLAEFDEVERQAFDGIDDMERALVWGLFGKDDPVVHTRPDFVAHYGEEQCVDFEGTHQLNDRVLKDTVLPIVADILGLENLR